MAFMMEMAGSNQADTENSADFVQVDYQGVNQHIIDACKTQGKERILAGIISGYNDLGKQPRKNYETPFKASDERMVADLAGDEPKAFLITKNYYDSDSKGWLNDCEVFSKPQTARQAITFTVTFPQIIVDIDPFYGKPSNPRPLNLIMGGQFFAKRIGENAKGSEPLIQDAMFVQENTSTTPKGADLRWGLGTTTTLHKMGNAANLLNDHGLMTKDKIGMLVGQAFQFKMRVFNKPNANNPDKPWYTEIVKFVSELPEGLPVPELPEGLEHGYNLFPAINGNFQAGKANDPATIETLHKRIINTVKRAEDFEGSVLEKELAVRAANFKAKMDAEKADANQTESDTGATSAASQSNVSTSTQSAAQASVEEDDWSDDIPF